MRQIEASTINPELKVRRGPRLRIRKISVSCGEVFEGQFFRGIMIPESLHRQPTAARRRVVDCQRKSQLRPWSLFRASIGPGLLSGACDIRPCRPHSYPRLSARVTTPTSFELQGPRRETSHATDQTPGATSFVQRAWRSPVCPAHMVAEDHIPKPA